ncbi:MAG: S26 family signal peptidase [Gammaproteobacteria bacterium]|jgi:conjugative transfer signal peptidase TraF
MRKIIFKKIKLLCFIILWVAVLLITLKIVVNWLYHRGYFITYQATTSMPKGFYFISPAKVLYKGDIVLFRPPDEIVRFLIEEKWLPKSGLMLKYVFALSGDYVCQDKKWIYINHHRVAPIYNEYAHGKKIPNSYFCGKLAKNQYLLMSIQVKRSFDGRYFGPVDRTRIIGVAKYLF